MNREQIISVYADSLAKLGLEPEQFVLGAGGALVMHGIRQHTRDMDMGVDVEVYQELLDSGEHPTRLYDDCVIIEWNDVLDLHPLTTGETVMIDGVCCYSLARVFVQKLALGRDKDQADITALRALLV